MDSLRVVLPAQACCRKDFGLPHECHGYFLAANNARGLWKTLQQAENDGAQGCFGGRGRAGEM